MFIFIKAPVGSKKLFSRHAVPFPLYIIRVSFLTGLFVLKYLNSLSIASSQSSIPVDKWSSVIQTVVPRVVLVISGFQYLLL